MAEPLSQPAFPHPSLSRELLLDNSVPTLVHSLREFRSSVLSLEADDDRYIYSGTQNQDIAVWDKKTFKLKETLRGHTGSVLALLYAKDKQWLFSASGDSTVRVWSTVSLTALYVIDPYLDTDAGDLFSLAWSPSLETIYIGCQNTSLQWFDFKSLGLFPNATSIASNTSSQSGTSTPSRKAHKFFDSYPQYERKPADIHAQNPGRSTPDPLKLAREQHLEIQAENVIDSAHYGYIYCMIVLESQTPLLVTGGGDEVVKLWDCSNIVPRKIHEFQTGCGAIYTIVARDSTIYAGCQDGYVKVIDPETRTIFRTILVQECVDILAMSLLNSDLYTCSANGRVQRFSASFDCTASWQAHDGIVLSSKVLQDGPTVRLLTGGNDDHINVWNIVAPPQAPSTPLLDRRRGSLTFNDSSTHDTMIYALTKFVAIPSVSSCLEHREDCRQAAIWLKKCLSQLGAQSSLLSTGEGINPLVFATFTGISGPEPKRRILFYGHYDVISAPRQGWDSEPFTVTGKNGYLYGRGVTDNKGPILAVALAAANLLYHRSLDVDLVFLVEGEEESGSTGFETAVKQHKDLIGHVDAILVSNSTWLTEEPPCITYGLRGVVHCTVEISNNLPDLHSGIDGGGVTEPMLDMIALLGTLTDRNHRVSIPGFYDHVRPQTPSETQLYQRLAKLTQNPPDALTSRWREPSLTVHNIALSGPKNATVIPGTVKAQVSIRIVPDQDLNTIIKVLCDHLETSFRQLNTTNKLRLSVENTADWWLGDFEDPLFQCLETAVQDEWGVEPLRIREGGSVPSVPFLEKEFKCHALHLPMGQSSDRAHLPNERISLTNLQRGKQVIERFLRSIGVQNTST